MQSGFWHLSFSRCESQYINIQILFYCGRYSFPVQQYPVYTTTSISRAEGNREGQEHLRRNGQTSAFTLISQLLSSVCVCFTKPVSNVSELVSPPLFFFTLFFFPSVCWCIHLSLRVWQGAITLSSCSLPFLSSVFLHCAFFSFLFPYCWLLFSPLSLLSLSPSCSLTPVQFPLCSLHLMGPDLPL